MSTKPLQTFTPFFNYFIIQPASDSTKAIISDFNDDSPLVVGPLANATQFSFTPEQITMNTKLPSGAMMCGGILNMNTPTRINDCGFYNIANPSGTITTNIIPVLSQFQMKLQISIVGSYVTTLALLQYVEGVEANVILSVHDNRLKLHIKNQYISITYNPNSSSSPSPSPGSSPAPLYNILSCDVYFGNLSNFELRISCTGGSIYGSIYDQNKNLISYNTIDISNSGFPAFDLSSIVFTPNGLLNFTNLTILKNPHDVKVQIAEDPMYSYTDSRISSDTTIITTTHQGNGFSTPEYQRFIFCYDYTTNTIRSLRDTNLVWTLQANSVINLDIYSSTNTNQQWNIFTEYSPTAYPYSIDGMWIQDSTIYDIQENFFSSITSILNVYSSQNISGVNVMTKTSGPTTLTRNQFNKCNDFLSSPTGGVTFDFLNWQDTNGNINALNPMFKYFDLAGYWISSNNNVLAFFPGSTATCFHVIFNKNVGGLHILTPHPVCRVSGTLLFHACGTYTLSFTPSPSLDSSTGEKFMHCTSLEYQTTLPSPTSSPMAPYTPSDATAINTRISFMKSVNASHNIPFNRVFIFMFTDNNIATTVQSGVLTIYKMNVGSTSLPSNGGSYPQLNTSMAYAIENYTYNDNLQGQLNITGFTQVADSPVPVDGYVFSSPFDNSDKNVIQYTSTLGTGIYTSIDDTITVQKQILK